MSTLSIFNPADGQLVNTLPADDAASVATKATAARSAQAAWAATPLSTRKTCVEKFRASVVHDMDALALTMTRETGKPVQLSRNELNGLLGRIDFFLTQVDGCLATETVLSEGSMT
ncbi:MAG: aldehyde dehydrogenase family protein, partial [Rhodoferax sp.]|nr:aldehyde dehydrogenase family protein [Rhodoferax sp.]